MKSSELKSSYIHQHQGPCHGDHLVHFYDKTDSLVQAFCNYAVPGLNRGEGVIVVATKQHRKYFSEGLQNRSIDVNRVISRGQLVMVDAHDMLTLFMHRNHPDKVKFHSIIGNILEDMKHKYSSIRVYGEMVNLLCLEGNLEGAMELEKFWDEIIKTESLSLLCAYSSDVLHESDLSFHGVCSAHSHVVVSDRFVKVM